MKRYEKMSKEEIIQLYTDFDCGDCNFCPLYDSEKAKHKCGEENDMSCSEEIKNWLNEEIEMIPRAWTFKTAEEAYKARKGTYETFCKSVVCSECKYFSEDINCNYNWLYKEVEKP